MDRPDDYYRQERTVLFSQGDIFSNVPFVDIDSESYGREVTRSKALLITPTDVMRAHGAIDEGSYATSVFAVVPVLPVTHLEVNWEDFFNDDLLHYMFLPSSGDGAIPESGAVLSEPSLLSLRVLLECPRIMQLTVDATRQLQRKLVMYYTMIQPSPQRSDFHPWAD